MSFLAIYRKIVRIEIGILAGFLGLGGLVTFAIHVMQGHAMVGLHSLLHAWFSGLMAMVVLQTSVVLLRRAFEGRG
ncbi:hypothetical protein A7Q10_11180 [Methylacidiphilum caldifontis]|uniref:Uncharacterized protein n=1 Tax=Methylacidiphilum caldifontis TaxID=2795386 RepID=A0A4Y8PES2_9BACT|nr:hypothetical protein A7Q10_11180 [Methylacidiphilum caldifontis]